MKGASAEGVKFMKNLAGGCIRRGRDIGTRSEVKTIFAA
jgi:hypothetical protein